MPCSARAHVLSQFAAAGVDTSRVDLLALAAANSDHLGTYSQMDISLDPFPYAGTTTTCESLYMGVPVVTLQGALLSLKWCAFHHSVLQKMDPAPQGQAHLQCGAAGRGVP